MFFFSFDPERPGSDLRARMFAPALGVAEDPATGSAVASLAGYLGASETTQTGTLRKVIEQGFEMGRPSILELELDKADGADQRGARGRGLGVGDRGDVDDSLI